jgi:ferrous iron transport protein A
MKNKKLLSLVKQGENVKIIGFERHGVTFLRRLQEMGILPGEVVKVVRNANLGPVEVIVKNSHLAIGRGIAAKIYVEELNE